MIGCVADRESGFYTFLHLAANTFDPPIWRAWSRCLNPLLVCQIVCVEAVMAHQERFSEVASVWRDRPLKVHLGRPVSQGTPPPWRATLAKVEYL